MPTATRKEASPWVIPIASLIGVWERGEGVCLEMGLASKRMVLRAMKRRDIDELELGLTARAEILNENRGTWGERQDHIVSKWIVQHGIGEWALDFMRVLREEASNEGAVAQVQGSIREALRASEEEEGGS